MMGTCITRCTRYRTTIIFKTTWTFRKTERCIYGRCDVRPDEVSGGRVRFPGALKLRRVMDRKSAAGLPHSKRQAGKCLLLVL